MITKPKVLLLDEPTEGIQPNIIQLIGKTIRLLRERGDIAIVLVEQNFDFAYDFSDMFYVMERGAIVRQSAKSETDRQTLLETLAL